MMSPDCITTGNHVWDQKEALVFAVDNDEIEAMARYQAGQVAGHGLAA